MLACTDAGEESHCASQWHSAWIRVPRCWMTWLGGKQEASPAQPSVAATLPVRARTSHACIVLGTLEYSFPGEDLDGEEGEQRKGERARPACGGEAEAPPAPPRAFFVGDDDAPRAMCTPGGARGRPPAGPMRARPPPPPAEMPVGFADWLYARIISSTIRLPSLASAR